MPGFPKSDPPKQTVVAAFTLAKQQKLEKLLEATPFDVLCFLFKDLQSILKLSYLILQRFNAHISLSPRPRPRSSSEVAPGTSNVLYYLVAEGHQGALHSPDTARRMVYYDMCNNMMH